MKLDTESLERIDSFPYRHRVSEVMSRPLATAAPQASLVDASRVMVSSGISSLVVVDPHGRAIGIITERDVLRAAAQTGSIGLHMPLSAVMSQPVMTVHEDAPLFVAMGRLERLKIRHLVVIDRAGMPVGMITARVLLKLRAGQALALGDEIAHAADAGQLAQVQARVPALAKALLGEGVSPLGVANITSTVLRDMTARAAELAERSMVDDGWGPAPVPACILVLGSGGRGESLFHPDQDNAIVHGGTDEHEPWFAEAGKRIATTLEAAGVPLCKGGVMAMNPPWRRSVDSWKAEIDRWVREARGEDVLNIDIFVDFRPVYGDSALADQVRAHLTEKAARSKPFLHMLAGSTADMRVPLGLFGNFITQGGRLDIKKAGLLPLVSAVRVLAVKHRIDATATRDRLDRLAESGHLPKGEAHLLAELHELLVDILLRQQIADQEEGVPLSNRIDPNRLDRLEKQKLKAGFKQIQALTTVLETALNSM